MWTHGIRNPHGVERIRATFESQVPLRLEKTVCTLKGCPDIILQTPPAIPFVPAALHCAAHATNVSLSRVGVGAGCAIPSLLLLSSFLCIGWPKERTPAIPFAPAALHRAAHATNVSLSRVGVGAGCAIPSLLLLSSLLCLGWHKERNSGIQTLEMRGQCRFNPRTTSTFKHILFFLSSELQPAISLNTPSYTIGCLGRSCPQGRVTVSMHNAAA